MTEAVGIHAHPTKKLGRRPASGKPALDLGQFLRVGQLPDHPVTDPVPPLSYPMDRNDVAGDCVVAGLDHTLQTVHAGLGVPRANWTDAELLTLYQTQNPGFRSWADGGGPNDNGMEIQTFLSYLQTHAGVISGFAKLNPANEELMKAATWLGLAVVTGEDLRVAQQGQAVWDYVPGSADWGGHCLAPGTRVLTDKLRWVPIEDVTPGQGLVGFDEHAPGPHSRRQYRRAEVESTTIIELPCYDLTFEDGTTVRASYDHQWLQGSSWVRTDAMRVGTGQRASRVRKPFQVWDVDDSRDAGYLAAAFDGEGWIDGEQSRAIHRMGFCQRDNAMWDHVVKALAERGFMVAERQSRISGHGKELINQLNLGHRDQVFRFLGTIRPHRLLQKFTPDRMGSMHSQSVRLVSKVPVGVQPVVAVKTTTGTFIAEGLASHNCTCMVSYAGSPDQDGFVTWGQVVQVTEGFVQHQVDEAWFVLTPAHIAHPSFRDNFDLAGFSAAVAEITGGKIIIPVTPPPPAPPPAPVPPAPAPVPPAPAPVPSVLADFPFAAMDAWAAKPRSTKLAPPAAARYTDWKHTHGL